MFSPRFPSPGRTVLMEREHHVSPQNKRSRPHHLPAQAPLWILSQFKLLLSPSVPLLCCLSPPGHLVLIRPLPSCWLWVLLTKFFHPFPHPRGSTTSTEDSPFSDTPEDDAGLSGRPPGMELSPHYSRRHWEGLPFVFSSLHLLSLPLPSQEHTPTSLTLPQTLRSQTDPSVINKSYLV